MLRGADDPDLEGAFRQSNNFAYLTGVDVPSAYLVLLPDDGRATLYLPPVNPHTGGFVESRPGPGPEAAERFGFERVESTATLLGDLFGAIHDPIVPTFRLDAAIVVTEDPDPKPSAASPQAQLSRLLHLGAPQTRFVDVAPFLGAMRKIKSESELALLRRAIDITGASLDEVMETLGHGRREFQLKGQILGTFLSEGAQGAGFASIVGSGPNGTIPHYFGNLRKLETGDLVVVDIGAEYQYYTADITRTYPVSGHFNDRQRAIYQLVLDAQKAVEAEMKPGETKLTDMTRFTRDFFDESPLRAKDENGEEFAMGHFFIHGLGHNLGMDVHDVGGYAEPVQVGEVFTIEPGLYIPSENIGVRIEDDYLMTEDGPLKLSKDIPSDPDAIERRIAEIRAKAASGEPAVTER